MRFSDLCEDDRIWAVKDSLARIVESIIRKPELLAKYIEPNTEIYKQVEKMLPNIQNTKCLCGQCIDISIINSSLMVLDPFIDAAKKEAEEGNY